MQRPQRSLNKLNAVRVAALMKRGRSQIGDGGGLWLVVTSNEAASFVFRYMLRGKARSMGVGSARILTLADARERAEAARKSLDAGIDPLDEHDRLATSVPPQSTPLFTFKDCAARYIESHSAGWKNPKHRKQWPDTLAAYANPVIGELDVGAIDTAHICTILEPIWNVKPETASRVRGRMEAVLGWATARGYRKGENPARWKGHLDNLFPPRSKVRRAKHHPSMPYADLGAFVQDLRKSDATGARALEFLILTATRTSETTGMLWEELDLAARTWTIPAARMKSGSLHRVPLSDRAIEILEAQRKLSGAAGPVFRGLSAKSPLSNMALLAVLKRMGKHEFTVHGYRSSFRDWSAEQTNYPREVCEAALAHSNRDKVESAYLRTDHFEKRRALMAAWSNYCSAPTAGATVIPMRKTAEQ